MQHISAVFDSNNCYGFVGRGNAGGKGGEVGFGGGMVEGEMGEMLIREERADLVVRKALGD